MMMNLTGSSSGVTVADLIRLKNKGADIDTLRSVGTGRIAPTQAESFLRSRPTENTLVNQTTLTQPESLTSSTKDLISTWKQEANVSEKEATSLFQFADTEVKPTQTPPEVTKEVINEIDAQLETLDAQEETSVKSQATKNTNTSNESDSLFSRNTTNHSESNRSLTTAPAPSHVSRDSLFSKSNTKNQDDTTRLLGGTQTAVSRILKTGGDSTVSNSPVENAYKELGSSLPPELIQAAREESKSATAQAILKNPGQFVDATTATTASIDNL